MKILFEVNDLEFDELSGPMLKENKISLSIARLDKIHPVISGNKLFKLYYFLEEALINKHRPVLTFGGAYSNHLAATAYACKISGIKSIGIVRGEISSLHNHTLRQCKSDGMELHFISRVDYNNKDSQDIRESLKSKFGDFLLIPEGGYHPKGALGAGLIMQKLANKTPSHVCTAIGTATTAAGLLSGSTANETIIGIPVLKSLTDIEERISYLCKDTYPKKLEIFDNYHFGGYAKKTSELICFMNEFYKQYQITTDFVYTAKMMYAIFDKIKKGYFPEGSKIICLHTGGLQGNNSLEASTLVF